MPKRNLGGFAVALLAVLNVFIWFVFTPPDLGTADNYSRQLVGEILGSTAFVLFACAIFLSTRPRYLESLFGGLDQIYQVHKKAAMAGLFLVIAHFFTLPLDPEKMKPGSPLGMIAFIGILLLIFLTVSPRVPLIGKLIGMRYDKWRKSHRLIGLFFILAFAHAMLVDPLMRESAMTFAYAQLFFVIGTGSYVWVELLAPFLRRKKEFVVSNVRRLNGSTTEVTLEARGEPLSFSAGQFVFVGFDGDKALREPHPFTISSAPSEGVLRLAIKASGDYTRYLYRNLKTGTAARVEGSYGRFDYTRGGRRQVWMAGGIGVTPFMSWIRQFGDDVQHEIDFFYTVRTDEEALFVDELRAAAERFDSFRFHLRRSVTDGFLTVDDVVQTSGAEPSELDVFMCGPYKMVTSFQRGFQKAGVNRQRIHFEEFNLR